MTLPHKTGRGLYLPPIVLQMTGLAVFIGAAVFWAVTGHESVLVMSAALSLTALGAYSGIHVAVTQEVDRDKKRRASDAMNAADEARHEGEIPFE